MACNIALTQNKNVLFPTAVGFRLKPFKLNLTNDYDYDYDYEKASQNGRDRIKPPTYQDRTGSRGNSSRRRQLPFANRNRLKAPSPMSLAVATKDSLR